MFLDLLWKLSRPLLFSLDAERAHRLVVGSLGTAPRLSQGMLSALAGPPAASQAVTLGPLTLAGPLGLAAGLDKDGEAIEVWSSLGFGFVEVGTVTAHPQQGNPQPRLFRLKGESGLINRMGFNNHGSAALAETMRALREAGRWPNVPVGANIGKSKITPLEDAVADYLTSLKRLDGLVEYFTVNVSSPNTPGLRQLQSAEPLKALLGAVVPAASAPVMVKFAPDLSDEDLASAVEVAIESGCCAIIATNTTNSRPGTTGRTGEGGGLSGAPLWPLARQRIGQILDIAGGRIPIVGVGGIRSPEQAAELLELGCAAVQLYSGMIFEGPGLISRINHGLQQA
ncbi:MAG: quinone-dependent dihydroorotate dehydrogenase [Myxococcota bacterium]|nr:quinone-dependent dihydroorotate dehydrogenase [Myxococcota bacterium]